MPPRWTSPKLLTQNVLPPALLTYYARTWYICVTEIGPQFLSRDLSYPTLGRFYSWFATLSILSISVLYLRLYFLPSSQSAPPSTPPAHILEGRYIYECAGPQGRVGLETSITQSLDLRRCESPQCAGRWKPPRARHCSDCGTCRMGFDHHCAFLANCLTAPYIPTFLLTLLYTAPTVLILSFPLLNNLGARAVRAYKLSWNDKQIVEGWYGWTWSWFIAGGPVGRYVGGIVLGWKELDRIDGVRMFRLEIGALVAVGLVLTAMTLGLAASSVETILKGDLTVDRERAKSFARLKSEIDRLVAVGKPVPAKTKQNIERLTAQTQFWVPLAPNQDGEQDNGETSGVIIPTLPGERPYDLGGKENWKLYMGPGLGWLLPWNALRRSVVLRRTIIQWPINPDVETRMRHEAKRCIARLNNVESRDEPTHELHE